MSPEPENVEARLDELFTAAGINPLPAERAIFAENYPAMRAAMDALYALPEARYADPAHIWTPIEPPE